MAAKIMECLMRYPCIRQSRLFGMILMALSGVMLTLSNFFVQLAIKENKKRIPTLEIVFVRSIVQLVLCIPLIIYTKATIVGEIKNIPSLLLMGISGFLSVTFIYLGIDKLPLGDATVITFMSPVFTSFFAYLLLEESCAFTDAVCGIFSFAGIIIVARPSVIFGEQYGHVTTIFHSGKELKNGESLYLMGVGFVLLGALFLSLYYVLVRKISITIDYIANIFYPSLLGSIFIPIIMLPFASLMFPACWKAKIFIVMVGVSGYIGLTLLAQSLKLEDAGPLTLIRNLDIIYAFVLQYGCLGIVPTLWNIGGATVVVSATSIIVARRWCIFKQSSKKNKDGNKYDEEEEEHLIVPQLSSIDEKPSEITCIHSSN